MGCMHIFVVVFIDFDLKYRLDHHFIEMLQNKNSLSVLVNHQLSAKWPCHWSYEIDKLHALHSDDLKILGLAVQILCILLLSIHQTIMQIILSRKEKRKENEKKRNWSNIWGVLYIWNGGFWVVSGFHGWSERGKNPRNGKWSCVICLVAGKLGNDGKFEKERGNRSLTKLIQCIERWTRAIAPPWNLSFRLPTTGSEWDCVA